MSLGFVFFVANLKKGHYRFQFSQFAWTHMTLLLVVCQSHFIINNIFEGLIWLVVLSLAYRLLLFVHSEQCLTVVSLHLLRFFLPVSLVIANDIWAYIFGFFMGKTPLIKLSPKKTVEGFIGGWAMTIVFGMLVCLFRVLSCPATDK